MSIQVKKVTLSPADIIAAFATPQLMLAAPASGYVNNILSITHDMSYNSAPYTTATTLYYVCDPQRTVQLYFDHICLPSTQDVFWAINKGVSDMGPPATPYGLYMQPDALPAGGDSDIDVYITYETIATS